MEMSVESIWEELSCAGRYPAAKRVSADHPLDLYAEISEGGHPGLLALSTSEPPAPPVYEAVDLKVGRRMDGRWAVSVVLVRTELKVQFSKLCDDIVEAGRSFLPVSQAGEFILARLARWRRLLDAGRNSLLSEQEVRGLVGELLFLKSVIPVFGSRFSVAGWNGPFDAPQDFELQGGSYEIKTVHQGAVTVRISSIDQLDTALGGLSLIVYGLSRSEIGGRSALTLPLLVDELRAMLQADELALQDFEARLLAAGYLERAEYHNMSFHLESRQCFSVTPEFPKLARSHLPHAFADARYDLFLAACEPFSAPPPGN